MRALYVLTILLALSVGEGLGCSCFEPADAKVAMESMGAVFRGKVRQKEILAQHPQMHGRARYRLTMQVLEQWRGELQDTVTLYDMDPGTDCMGTGLQVGREYLVYASDSRSADTRIEDKFWFGWIDVVPEGTPMLRPDGACLPGGLVSDPRVQKALKQIGKGRVPSK